MNTDSLANSYLNTSGFNQEIAKLGSLGTKSFASSLKTFHPELFDKYAFEDNINVLCDLQLKHELPSEISQCIHDAKNQIYNRTTKAELNQDSKSTEIEH